MASSELSRRVGTVDGPDEASMVPALVLKVTKTCFGTLRDLIVGSRIFWASLAGPKDVGTGIVPFMTVFLLGTRP
jgi:hypothetical protein